MSLPRIIGITGFAQHGKDTIASVLTRELGYNRIALADKMKEALYALNPIVYFDPDEDGTVKVQTMVDEDGWDSAKRHPQVRALLQRLGTQVGRNILGEDTWIGALAKEPGVYGNERKIVIPDVRFQNEADWVRRNHGQLWLVQRPDFDNGIGTEHESERDIPALRVDRVFVNSGSKSDFKEVVLRDLRFQLALVKAQEDYRPALDQLADR